MCCFRYALQTSRQASVLAPGTSGATGPVGQQDGRGAPSPLATDDSTPHVARPSGDGAGGGGAAAAAVAAAAVSALEGEVAELRAALEASEAERERLKGQLLKLKAQMLHEQEEEEDKVRTGDTGNEALVVLMLEYGLAAARLGRTLP